jgi:hypothetical protein
MSEPTTCPHPTTLLARLVARADEFYRTATAQGSTAGDFTRGQAWGELRQAIRCARVIGGFDANVSDAYVTRWAHDVVALHA